MKWPWHRHQWETIGIWNHPNLILSYFMMRCSICHRYRDEEHRGHWSLGTNSAGDTEITELRKMAGLEQKGKF